MQVKPFILKALTVAVVCPLALCDVINVATHNHVSACGKRVLGYYPSFAQYPIKLEQMKRLTHLIFAFLETKQDGRLTVGDSSVRGNSTAVKRRINEILYIRRHHTPNLKVMFAVGGWENSQYFSSIAGSLRKRKTFIKSIIGAIRRFGFDGVDIDWEHPVTGGAVEGTEKDKENYVTLMRELRIILDRYAKRQNRTEKYLISFAGAAGQWTLDPGYDLEKLLQYADFANIMTYDYFGPWNSKWGAFTGPPAPLYFAMPEKFSGKTNVDWTVKYYVCKTRQPHKLNMGVPFYGRFWKNVGEKYDENDGMWRKAEQVNGKYEGGSTTWREIREQWAQKPGFTFGYHDKVEAPYAYSETERTFLGFESPKSLKRKVDYAMEKDLGGIMIWSIDQDDPELTMISVVDQFKCNSNPPKQLMYKCSPITERRWWTFDDGEDKAGLCGRSAPLINGYYPVCDPDDPGYHCCGQFGYCGQGEEYCNCPSCIDYGENPERILEEPIKPSSPVHWYSLSAPTGRKGRCGRDVPKVNDEYAICNPDDPTAHCCSPAGYCGSSPQHCQCDGCVDFAKTPHYRYSEKKWWTWTDGPDKSGKCGVNAPQINGKDAICDPDSNNAHCCSKNGWCGTGPEFCDCDLCVDYRYTVDSKSS